MLPLAKKIMFLFVFLLFPFGLAFDVNLVKPLADGFHEGEYIGNVQVISNYYSGMSSFPLLIHGAMDYLPSLLARDLAGDGKLLVWTRFLNVLAVALCWILYVDISRVSLQKQSEKIVWGVFFYISFIWMAIAAGTDPVSKQQAFLGTRDLFLILSVWAGAKALYCRNAAISSVYMIVSGAFAGVCIYWSYDRGVLSAIWIVGYVIALLYQRKIASAIVVFIAYLMAVFLMSEAKIVGSLGDNLNNVMYWVNNTGDVWFLAFKMKLTALPGVVAMSVFSLLVMSHAVIRVVRKEGGEGLPVVFGLILVQLVFLSKMYSLPGFPTSYYFIWPSFLLLMLIPPKSKIISEVNRGAAHLVAIVEKTTEKLSRQDRFIIFGVGVLMALMSSNSVVSGFGKAMQLARPLPDEMMVDRNHYGVDVVGEYKFDCVFLWTNEGVFSTLLNKPYCGKYTYGVYISKNEEMRALDYLRNNPPGLIVYDSPFWSMSIYGRHMRDRLPAIDRFIHENYVFHDSKTGYTFATPHLH